MKLVRSLAFWALLLAALAPAGAAAAENRTYINLEGFGPSGGAAISGPATHYPGTVTVTGVPGTVTRVTLTALELSANGDLDMVLVGPNGAQVMLMSDACTTKSVSRAVWTFEDAAPTFVPQLSCPFGPRAGVLPTNYGDPEDDDFASFPGGPAGPYTNQLSAFNGISPNGNWNLFMLDDDPTQVVGFEMTGFALNLEVEPPPPAPPVVQTVTVPGPERTVTVTKSVASQGSGKTAKTGKRAAALAKCKLKKTEAKKTRCRAKARKLPV